MDEVKVIGGGYELNIMFEELNVTQTYSNGTVVASIDACKCVFI